MQNLSESIIVDPNCAGRHMIKTLMQVGAGAMKNLHILLKKGHNIHCIVFYLHKHLSSWLLGLKYLHLRTNLSVIVLKILTKLPPVLSSRFTTSNVINHHSFAFLNVHFPYSSDSHIFGLMEICLGQLRHPYNN